MKIFVNYVYDATTNKFQIVNFGGVVLATEKVAIRDTEIKIKEPLVVEVENSFPIVVDRESYEKNHRVFNLKENDDGTFDEVDENEAEIRCWFTKDTDVKKLKRINGRIAMVDFEKRNQEKRDKTKEN